MLERGGVGNQVEIKGNEQHTDVFQPDLWLVISCLSC